MDDIRLGSRTLQPRRQLLVNGRREAIGKRALDILSVLGEARGQIVTKDELLDAVWPGVTVEENALQVHIVALRKALGPEADRLKTIRGVGYQLELGPPATPTDPQVSLREAAGSGREEPAAAGPAPASATAASVGPRAVQPATLRPAPATSWLRARAVYFLLPALLVALVAAGLAAWSGLSPGPGDRIPIVVRPLTASGTGDRTESALAGGITDELIVRLRRIPELRIGTGEPGGRVEGDAFRKAYTVDGTIRSAGDQLKVTARLTNAAGEILWSQTFDRRLSDMFDMQETIAAAIADALGVSLDVGANSAAFGGTDSPAAYAAYLQYRAHLLDADQMVPRRYLEQALAIDPDYVKALVALSFSYGIQSNFAATREQALALLAKMDASTTRAVTANPQLWIGHAARGSYFNERRNFASAAKSFARVAALDKGIDPELRDNLATYFLLNGSARKALALLDSNETIDPITRHNPMRVWALAMRGEYKESIDLFERLSASDPASVEQFAVYVFWAHLLSGHEADADRFAQDHGLAEGAGLRAFRSDSSLTAMSPEQLRKWAAQRFGDGRHFDLANLAIYAGYTGHTKLAADLLRLAFERPGGFGVSVLWHPAMAGTRKTDDFKQLVSDIGLVRFWRESGSWPDACHPLSAAEFTCT